MSNYLQTAGLTFISFTEIRLKPVTTGSWDTSLCFRFFFLMEHKHATREIMQTAPSIPLNEKVIIFHGLDWHAGPRYPAGHLKKELLKMQFIIVFVVWGPDLAICEQSEASSRINRRAIAKKLQVVILIFKRKFLKTLINHFGSLPRP